MYRITILRFFIPSLLILASASVPVHAQSYTWNQSTTGNWNAAGNWDAGIPPSVNTTALVFNGFLDTGYQSNNDLAGIFVLNSMTFNNQSGGTIVVNNNAGSSLQFAGANAALTMFGPGAVTIQGTTVDLAAATAINGGGSGILTISSQITGTGSLTINRTGKNFLGVTSLTSATANTFNGLTIQNGILAIGAGNVVGNGTITIATTGTRLNATGELRNGTAGTLTINNPVTINSGATLNNNAGPPLVFGQAVNGAGGVNSGNELYFTGGMQLIFERASGYTGRTDMTRSALVLRGTAGALTGTTQLEFFRNASLTLDSNAAITGTGNTTGNEASQNRLRDDATIGFHRTNFNFTANAAATTTETLGTLNFDGFNIAVITPNANAGAALTINAMNRLNRGTFEFQALNLGNAAPGTVNTSTVVLNQLNGAAPAAALVGGGGAAGTTNISIIPFFVGTNAVAAPGTTFLTYGANGLRHLNTATEFATSIQVTPYLAGATDNVRTTIPLVVASQPVTVNSLVVASPAGGTAGVYGFGGFTGRLNVTSGAVLNSTATGAAATTEIGLLGVAELNFAGAEAVFTSDVRLVASSAFTNNTGLNVSGASRLSLVGTNNVFGGPISMNFGSLQINGPTNLGEPTAINFHGGILQISNLATGSGDTFGTPINVGSAGAYIQLIPVGLNASGTAQVATLTGSLSGAGSLQFNGNGVAGPSGGGTAVLAGTAGGYSGMVVVNAGVLQFDADARLGTGTAIGLGSTSTTQPATLHASATTATNKNLYLMGLGFVRTDAGVTYTMNGFITGTAATSEFRKVGAGNLVLTGEANYGGPTVVGNSAVTFLNVGGTLSVRDQGVISNTSAFTVTPGSTLAADNTGSANLSNRLNNVTVNLAGGTLQLLGSTTAASTETVGLMNLVTGNGSMVEVAPGATQTASLFFSSPTTGGFVRNTGTTVTLRAPGLGGTATGTGQINFIHNTGSPTGPTLTAGILAGAFGEDTSTSALGLITLDTVAATPTFPQYYRTRQLTAGEYTLNAFPNTGTVTTNHRQTAAAAPTGSPTVNALVLDAGGSLAVAGGNTVTLTSGTMILAGGTSVTGGATANLAVPASTDLAVYVGTGGNATLGTNLSFGSTGRFLAKVGPGTLDLTTAISATAPPGTVAVQRGTFRLGTGGSLPTSTIVNVDAGATFDVNGTGGVVEIATLNGLGNVQLGATVGTVLRVGGAVTSFFGGTMAGTGSLEKTGASILEFTHTANYTGPITLNAGAIRYGDGNVNSPLIPSVTGGAITAVGGTQIDLVNVQSFARDLVLSGATGTVTLSNSTFGGTTRVNSAVTVPAGMTLLVNTQASGLWRLSGSISGGGGVTYQTNVNNVIEGNNSYSGPTNVNTAGFLHVGSNTAFGSGGTVTFAAAMQLTAFGANRTIANPIALNADLTFGTTLSVFQGFDLTFTGDAALNANRIVTTVAGGRLTLTNVSGVGFTLTKAGGGTLALAGPNNTYSGTTTVSSGTLLVNGTLTAGGGAVTVGATGVLGGTGTINRQVNVSALGAVNPGTSPGTITMGGGLALAANSIYFWELGSNTTAGPGTNWDKITVNGGTLAITAGAVLVPAFVGTSTQPNGSDAFWQSPRQWTSIVEVSGSATNPSGLTALTVNNTNWSAFGTFTTIGDGANGVTLVWTPVPEPATVLGLAAGAMTLAGLYRRSRRREG